MTGTPRPRSLEPPSTPILRGRPGPPMASRTAHLGALPTSPTEEQPGEAVEPAQTTEKAEHEDQAQVAVSIDEKLGRPWCAQKRDPTHSSGDMVYPTQVLWTPSPRGKKAVRSGVQEPSGRHQCLGSSCRPAAPAQPPFAVCVY